MRAPPQRKQDLIKNDRRLRQHIVVPEAQNPKASPFDEASSSVVVRSSIHMLAAIQLDHQLRIQAGEVREVRTYRALTAKLVVGESAIAQPVPEDCFCVCGGLA